MSSQCLLMHRMLLCEIEEFYKAVVPTERPVSPFITCTEFSVQSWKKIRLHCGLGAPVEHEVFREFI